MQAGKPSDLPLAAAMPKNKLISRLRSKILPFGGTAPKPEEADGRAAASNGAAKTRHPDYAVPLAISKLKALKKEVYRGVQAKGAALSRRMRPRTAGYQTMGSAERQAPRRLQADKKADAIAGGILVLGGVAVAAGVATAAGVAVAAPVLAAAMVVVPVAAAAPAAVAYEAAAARERKKRKKERKERKVY